MKQTFIKLIGAASLSAVLLSTTVQAETIALKGGTIHTVSAAGMIENGTLVITDGKITAVGTEVNIPADARVIDTSGKIIVPGFMNSNSRLGLSEITMTRDSNEHSAKGSPFGAAFDVRYGLNHHSVVIADNRRQGLTHALTQASNADGIFKGQGAIISLDGSRDMIMADGPMAAVLFAGGNRSVAWAKIRLIMDQVKHYARNRSNVLKGKGRSDYMLDPTNMDALLPLVKGDQALYLNVNSENDILQAISLKNDTGIKIIIVGASEAWRVADDLVRADVPVVIDPQNNLPENFGHTSASYSNAALLEKAGVTFAISPGGMGANHNAYMVNQVAGIAVGHGLSWETALKAITLVPAQMFGIDGSYGSLEEGKVANVVVWDGDPLEVTSNTEYVIIKGVEYPLVSRRTLLKDRYLDLDKKPFALK